jgi:hypothetical protein
VLVDEQVLVKQVVVALNVQAGFLKLYDGFELQVVVTLNWLVGVQTLLGGYVLQMVVTFNWMAGLEIVGCI